MDQTSPVLLMCFNNLELTKNAVASVFSQDIPVELILVDNGSTDGTKEWLNSLEAPSPHSLVVRSYKDNVSPILIGNREAATAFVNHSYILGIPNDVVLPPNLYRELLRWPRGFVCASPTEDPHFGTVDKAHAVSENTPMAVILLRKWAYQALIAKDGYFFDEQFFHYASDCDLALRMAACGIRGVQLDIPYYHVVSATLKNSPERRKMEWQADMDRAYFELKWGFKVDSLEYGQVASDPNFVAQGLIS